MKSNGQFILPMAHELIVDLFAGGGGASTGIEMALDRHVDIAINHDPQAVSLHEVNHPQTRHFVSDVFEVDPITVCGDQPIGLLWASPDCKHFSKAKGGKPVSKKIRGLAWVVIKWAKLKRPRVICLENVEEFRGWGKLGADGKPDPAHKGKTFERWCAQLRNLGYVIEHRELRACDYGVPTIRKRLFLVARCDGAPIVWPEKTHGPGLKPFKTAADIIDWSHPCPSIFERKKELAPATMRRIAHGIKRYVIDSAKPYIVRIGQTGWGDGGKVHSTGVPLSTVTTKAEHLLVSPTIVNTANSKTTGRGPNVWPAEEPLRTVTSSGAQALASATLIQTGYGERPGQAPRVPGLDKPLGTAVDGVKHALVAAFMAQHNTDNVGHPMTKPVSTIVGKGCTQGVVAASLATYYGGDDKAERGQPVDSPLATQTTANRHSLVTSNLVKLRGTSNSAATDAPIGTVSAGGQHHAEVRAFLIKYYGTDQDPQLTESLHTVTTKDRFGLVTVDCVDYYIADIGMRMLQPRELYRAQGFPDTYIIDRGADGAPLPKDAQVRMCGNSVCPPLAAAIVRANYSDMQTLRRAA